MREKFPRLPQCIFIARFSCNFANFPACLPAYFLELHDASLCSMDCGTNLQVDNCTCYIQCALLCLLTYLYSVFQHSVGMFEDYLGKYDAFVKTNPRLTAEIEAIIRWSSYLIATKKSPVLGELLSSGANLLQLCNDIILRQANSELNLNLSSFATQLKTFLAAIQSLELLAEIYARDTYGEAGRWVFITVIQITKAIIKLLLLVVFDDGISKTQSIVPLDRLHYTEIVKLQERFGQCNQGCESESSDTVNASDSLVLKSSGRRMKSLAGSSSKDGRFNGANDTDTRNSFTDLQKKRLKLLLNRYREQRSAQLTEKQIFGEILHISRPIAHLALMGAFGTKSWISYCTSLMLDISSLYLIRSPLPLPQHQAGAIREIPQCYQFNMNERMELGQRASSLLMYLLRSPFFDNYTKQRALEGLATTAENIPLFGQFLATFINYIPDWQKDYFRVWSD